LINIFGKVTAGRVVKNILWGRAGDWGGDLNAKIAKNAEIAKRGEADRKECEKTKGC